MQEQQSLFSVDVINTCTTEITLTRREIGILMNAIIQHIKAPNFEELSALYDKLFDAREEIDNKYLD